MDDALLQVIASNFDARKELFWLICFCNKKNDYNTYNFSTFHTVIISTRNSVWTRINLDRWIEPGKKNQCWKKKARKFWSYKANVYLCRTSSLDTLNPNNNNGDAVKTRHSHDFTCFLRSPSQYLVEPSVCFCYAQKSHSFRQNEAFAVLFRGALLWQPSEIPLRRCLWFLARGCRYWRFVRCYHWEFTRQSNSGNDNHGVPGFW